MDPARITTAVDPGYAVGDKIRIIPYRPWWIRLWHWITRRKPEADDYVVTSVTSTSFTIGPREP